MARRRRSGKSIPWLWLAIAGVAAYFFRGQLKAMWEKYVSKKAA